MPPRLQPNANRTRTMSRVDGNETCEHCSASFPYSFDSQRLQRVGYAYCGSCGRTACLSGWCAQIREGGRWGEHGLLPGAAVALLAACVCGGHFTREASPRCPVCLGALSLDDARSWIEAHAVGSSGGWRWQGSWAGLYSIVIADRVLTDNWRLNGRGYR